jgi:hypothetical protein
LCGCHCKGEDVHGTAVPNDAYTASEKHKWEWFSHTLTRLRFPRNSQCTDIRPRLSLSNERIRAATYSGNDRNCADWMSVLKLWLFGKLLVEQQIANLTDRFVRDAFFDHHCRQCWWP